MHWFLLGISSAFLMAAVTVTDKVLLERYFKGNWAYPFYTALFLGLYCLGILITRIALGHFYSPSIQTTLLALLPGLLHYAAALVFTRAMWKADASTVAGISQINPLFALIWGAMFLGDVLSLVNFFSVVLLVACAVLLAWQKPDSAVRGIQLNQAALGFVLFGAFLRSLSDLFLKFALTDLPFWDAFALSRLGMILPALSFLFRTSINIEVRRPIVENGWKVIALVGGLEIVALVNMLLLTAAFATGPFALVSTTQSLAPLFIVLLTGLVNTVFVGLVPVRDTSLKTWHKLFLGFGCLVGVYLLAVQ
jgi:uncharacterized membrane protein